MTKITFKQKAELLNRELKLQGLELDPKFLDEESVIISIDEDYAERVDSWYDAACEWVADTERNFPEYFKRVISRNTMNIAEMIKRLVSFVGKYGGEVKVKVLKEEEKDFEELLDIVDENVKVIEIVNSGVEYLSACGNCNVEKIYINGGAYLGTDLDRKMDELEQEMFKIKKAKEVDEITLIELIEGGAVLVEDEEHLEIVRKLAKDLSRSMGFYGRLYEDLKGMEEALPFVL